MKSSIQLYNTLSRELEPFEPLDPEGKDVKLYVCGPTVYDEAHLGHARCYITWDILYRFLCFSGYTVHYARNITDVDDKIINRAKESGQTPEQIATTYTASFHEVMAKLNVLSPTSEPRATQHIEPMLAFVQTLLDNSTAYVTDTGNVYYNTRQKADYGKLCQQPLEDLQSGARVDVEPEKQNALDFALWKIVDASEPGWDSPWGWGRPGWHLECSTMIQCLFGDQIDIHTGGFDLVFPHHENEIAQSEACTGRAPFVKYWMHNGFVNISGEKMSKSLGNFSTIRSLLEHYNANTLRYFILTNHYRMPVNFSDDALESAKNWEERTQQNIQSLLSELNLSMDTLPETPATTPEIEAPVTQWHQAMATDLNTADALAQLNKLLSLANASSDTTTKTTALAHFVRLAHTLGFNFQPQTVSLTHLQPELIQLLSDLGQATQASEPEVLLDTIIALRTQARTDKDWAQSDLIRDRLGALGIQLKDAKDSKTQWLYVPQ